MMNVASRKERKVETYQSHGSTDHGSGPVCTCMVSRNGSDRICVDSGNGGSEAHGANVRIPYMIGVFDFLCDLFLLELFPTVKAGKAKGRFETYHHRA